MPTPPPSDELEAWQELYNATGGHHWHLCATAPFYHNPCMCKGKNKAGPSEGEPHIRCNQTSGNIKAINLRFWNLQGTIPPAIAKLQYLDSIDMTANLKLSGTLPPALGNLSNFHELFVGGRPSQVALIPWMRADLGLRPKESSAA